MTFKKGPMTTFAKLVFTKNGYRKIGRWRTTKKASECHTDTEIPVPDANIANALRRPLGSCCFLFKIDNELLKKDFSCNSVCFLASKNFNEDITCTLTLPCI